MSSSDVIVFDFDGILAEGSWPRVEIGAPIPAGLLLLQQYYLAGWCIRIHTARPVQHVPDIQDWLEDHGVGSMVYEVIGGKPLGDLYVDDKAFRPAWCDQTLPGLAPGAIPDEVRYPQRMVQAPRQGADPRFEPEEEPEEPLDPEEWTVMG